MWYSNLVKEWLAEVWDELHQKKPAFFTNDCIKSIPLELIPHMRHESVREEMNHEVDGENGEEGKRGIAGFSRRRSTRLVIGEVLGRTVVH